ncbi:MAG TPA: phosphatase PAP2 family protein [Dehalococcoidales bacterium]|nr:phosphatase PAP2 family protein [Dehalococcoidales bacterium]
MRERLAQLTSNILNPFLVSLIVIILLSVEATAGSDDALKWSLISIALSVLPVFAVVIYMVRQKKLDGIFVNPRQQRSGIYLLATVLAVIACFVLIYLEAPKLLKVTFIAGLAAIVVFMVINRFWKISLHTAFVAASVTVMTIVYGAAGALTILLLPPVAWARIRLKQHSPAQVAAGALISAAIVVVVFWGLGEML